MVTPLSSINFPQSILPMYNGIVTWVNWLDNELNERGWSYAELSRRSHISESAFSRVRKGERKPGKDMCEGVSTALKIPIEIVYRYAWGLPEPKKYDNLSEEALYLFIQLSDDDKEDQIAEMRWKLERRHGKGSSQPP